MQNQQIDSIVELENVSKDYTTTKTIHALRSISFSIMRGERVALMGPSGSGKSTLLNLICGLDKPTLGVIRFEGVNLSALTDDLRTRLRRVKIGMIFQSFNLLPTLSTIENVSMPLRLNGASRREAERRAKVIIEKVGLADRQMHRPDELSGGERQRVAIARALIFRPSLLLADEPTGNLDSITGEEILSLLDELHREYDTTVLLVTHNALAAAHCDRIVTLLDGHLSGG
jgi:putative ABC transport system ATP-binding protein